jgi:alpha-tubulin suppressor-like RCC1 family protein
MANLVANVTISGNTLILAASSNVQYINAASSNIFTFAAGIATVNRFPAVAGGQYHTAVLLSDGTVRTFGGNSDGQLGLNDTTQRVVPVTVPGIAGATAVACGWSHTAVLLADGTVRTFGFNDNGQLGINDTTNRSTPVQVFGISSSATAVACGGAHTTILLADGTVRTFGSNNAGQLGVNVAGGSRQTPVQVFGISSSATAVACGSTHTAILLADGTVRTFGYNGSGQLGVNDNTNRPTPVQVFGISSSATAIACGQYHSAVVLADGTVRTFGFNSNGQLGVNDTTTRQTPVQVFGISSSATAVAAGLRHTAVLLADGTVRTFGRNNEGQIGVNDTTGRETPVQVFGISSSATAVLCGRMFTAILLSDGTLRTFGQNNFGQLGLGDTASRLTPVQVVSALSYGGSFKIAGGASHTAVILTDGTVRTFGYNAQSSLGVNDTTDRYTPVQVWGISSSATAVACAGAYHTAVLLANGTIRTFGFNAQGQLGVNDTATRPTPVQVFGISSSATAVACGRFNTAVLLVNGTVMMFGDNRSGQLGVNDNTNRPTPVQVFGISSSATALAGGFYHTAVLVADGTVRTFGQNDVGQLGINDTTSRQTPVQVLNITSATALAGGRKHTAVLLADGTVMTFGYNSNGELGINDTTSRQTPVQVWGISSSATAVACGRLHTAVLLADGTVRTFGNNGNGALGLNDITQRNTPVQVFGISSSAVAIACGQYNTAVLLANGTVRTFGLNGSGQLGVNDTTQRNTPVTVLNIINAGSLASTTFLTSAQTPFTFNGPVFTTNLGLGRVPDISYQLDLSSDGARKLQSSTWTTGSDRRIKSDIQTANLARCAEIVDSLDLKYFEWLSAEHTDRHSLGWIAQDVLTFFPKSVSLTESGTLALDSDQLVKVLWGALKHTLNEHFAPEVPTVSEPVTVPEVPVVSEVTEVPATTESLSVDPVPEASENLSENTVEVPATTESLSVDPVPEASENLSENTVEVPVVAEVTEVTEPVSEVTEVPVVAEPVPEVTEPVPEATEVTEPVPEVTEVPVVAEPVPEVTEVPVVPAVSEPVAVPEVTEVPEVPEVTEPVSEVTEVPVVPEVTEVPEVPATTESLSVPEASESLSENTVEVPVVTEVPVVAEVTEPVVEVPAVSEPVVVPEVTEVTEVPATTESLSELVTEVPVVAEVTEPVVEVPAAPESVPE